MKLCKSLLIVFTILINLLIAQPSWADPPKLTQTPEYMEVNQALNELIQAKNSPEQTEYKPEEIEQKIGELTLQKYILETALEWSQCHNLTGQTLGVYIHKVKNNQEPTLYYLENGKTTDDEWNCDGIYLPTGIKLASSIPGDTQVQDLIEPLALKIIPGTQLIATNNPQSGAIELNIRPTKVFKTGETPWILPNLTSANISNQIPNAPIED